MGWEEAQTNFCLGKYSTVSARERKKACIIISLCLLPGTRDTFCDIKTWESRDSSRFLLFFGSDMFFSGRSECAGSDVLTDDFCHEIRPE